MSINDVLNLFPNGTEFVISRRTYGAEYDDVSDVYLGKVGEPKKFFFGNREVALCRICDNQLILEFSEYK